MVPSLPLDRGPALKPDPWLASFFPLGFDGQGVVSQLRGVLHAPGARTVSSFSGPGVGIKPRPLALGISPRVAGLPTKTKTKAPLSGEEGPPPAVTPFLATNFDNRVDEEDGRMHDDGASDAMGEEGMNDEDEALLGQEEDDDVNT